MKSKRFLSHEAVTEYINENSIKQNQIVQIIVSGDFVVLFWYEKEEKTTQSKQNDDLFNSYTNNENLLLALRDFEKMRKSIKKPLSTVRAKEMLLTKLDSLSDNEETKIAILNQSILNNWQSVFPLKDNAPMISKDKPISNSFIDLIESGALDE